MENKKIFSYYNYSNLGYYIKDFRSGYIIKKELLNFLEIIKSDK